MVFDKDVLAARVKTMRDLRPEYRPLLDLYIFLTAAAADTPVNLPAYDREVAMAKLNHGFSLFTPEELPLDLEAALDIFGRFTLADVPNRAGIERLASAFNADKGLFQQTCHDFLKNDEASLAKLAENLAVESDLIRFLIPFALKPSLAALREAESGIIEQTGWDEGFCPLCGSAARMARLENDGARKLFCGLCGLEWRFPRLKCAFCGTRDQADLPYYYIEEEVGYRIDHCRQCRNYLKVIDLRKREDALPMELEDLLTLHLDLAADKELRARDA